MSPHLRWFAAFRSDRAWLRLTGPCFVLRSRFEKRQSRAWMRGRQSPNEGRADSMLRKSLVLSVLLLLVLAGSVVGGAYLLLRHEPESYVLAEMPPGKQRQSYSDECTKEITSFLTDKVNCEGSWKLSFTQDQLNSYLAEDFVNSGWNLLPAGVSQPRIQLQDGRLRLAFRYGEDEFSTVVSLQVKVWLPKRERSAVAVEIESLRAGAIPLSWKLLQEQLTEGARNRDIDVQWYRNDGNPVAVVRFQADKREPTIQFQQLQIKQGHILISGKSRDPESLSASFQLPRSAAAE